MKMSEAKKKTYLEMLAERKAFDEQLEITRKEEQGPVIEKMKADIAAYQITAEQLGFVLVAPTPPAPAKPATPAKKQPKVEKDADGNSIRYLADGSRKPFTYFNPAGKEKAFDVGTRPAWLNALIASKVDPATYTIKPV